MGTNETPETPKIEATKPPEQRMQGYTHPFWVNAMEVNTRKEIDKEFTALKKSIKPGDMVFVKDEKETLPSSTQVGGSHYKDLAIQPIHFSERNKLTPMEHTAIKYITRHRFKGTGRQDIEKAIHTLNLILEEYYPNATS